MCCCQVSADIQKGAFRLTAPEGYSLCIALTSELEKYDYDQPAQVEIAQSIVDSQSVMDHLRASELPTLESKISSRASTLR